MMRHYQTYLNNSSFVFAKQPLNLAFYIGCCDRDNLHLLTSGMHNFLVKQLNVNVYYRVPTPQGKQGKVIPDRGNTENVTFQFHEKWESWIHLQLPTFLYADIIQITCYKGQTSIEVIGFTLSKSSYFYSQRPQRIWDFQVVGYSHLSKS